VSEATVTIGDWRPTHTGILAARRRDNARMTSTRLWLLPAALLLAQGLAAAEGRGEDSFRAWQLSRQAEVAAFGAMLQAEGLAAVVPLEQLLRSASHWAACRAEPFAVPPQSQWPAVQSTLRLLRQLQVLGVLGEFEVVSGYRGPALNACAGGAAQSAHLQAFAVDLLPRDADAGARLCRFWREQGQDWQMGLSRYPSGRVHIDTWRYRSWGADHSGRSSFCGGEAVALRR
jgi:Peptidase M15